MPTILSNEEKELDGKRTIIYRHIKLAEGPVHELPINFYATKSAGAAEYRELAKELLSHEDQKAG